MYYLTWSSVYIIGVSCFIIVSGQDPESQEVTEEPDSGASPARASASGGVFVPTEIRTPAPPPGQGPAPAPAPAPPSPKDVNSVDQQYSTFCNRTEIEKYKGSCAKQITAVNDTIHRIKEQNKILTESLLKNLIRMQEIPEFEPKEGFKLIGKTLNIFRKMCPIVDKTFLRRVEMLYKVLNYRLASTRTDYFKDSSKHVTWINSILDKCYNESQKMEFTLNQCKDTILFPKGNSSAFICTKLSEEMNARLYDPILDTIWLVISSIRSGCFHYFHESYQMWHNYFLALMDTFSGPLQIRWTNQLEDLSFWKRILGPNFAVDMNNVERCSKFIISKSELGPYSMSSARGMFIPYVRLEGSH